ncbi:hypothetical protein AAFP35_18045 [Gordonia sp. CPCC 206044]
MAIGQLSLEQIVVDAGRQRISDEVVFDAVGVEDPPAIVDES